MIEVWQIGIAQVSAIDGGFLTVQVDAHGDGATSAPAQVLSPYGFVSRPRDPSSAGGCEVLYASEGGAQVALIAPDNRAPAPEIAPGSAALYVLTDAGKSSTLVLDGAGGGVTLTVDSASGAIVLDHGGAKLAVGNSVVDVGGDGGQPIVIEDGRLAAFFNAVASALQGLGAPVTAPSGFTATKAKAL